MYCPICGKKFVGDPFGWDAESPGLLAFGPAFFKECEKCHVMIYVAKFAKGKNGMILELSAIGPVHQEVKPGVFVTDKPGMTFTNCTAHENTNYMLIDSEHPGMAVRGAGFTKADVGNVVNPLQLKPETADEIFSKPLMDELRVPEQYSSGYYEITSVKKPV